MLLIQVEIEETALPSTPVIATAATIRKSTTTRLPARFMSPLAGFM